MTANPHDGGHGCGANDVGGIAPVFTGVRTDVQVDYIQLCVVVLVSDEKSAR